MSADDIVNIQIVLQSKAPTAAGFGRPMFFAFHTHFMGRSKLYSASTGLADMLTDGFLATDKVFHDVQTLLSQKPAPRDFTIGRRLTASTQTVNLIPTVTTQGFVYSGEIDDVSWSYTVLAAATVATISTALAALFSGLGVGITASGASTTWAACTSNVAGKVHRFENTVPELRFKDVTTDPGITSDLTTLLASDSDWFGMILDSQSKAEVLAAASVLETARKVMAYATADYEAKDGASTVDVLFTAKSSAFFNSLGFWYHEVGSSAAAGAWGVLLTSVVGSEVLAHQEIILVTPSDKAANGSRYLSDAEAAAVVAKNGNTYTTLGAQGDIFPGKVAGGDFISNVRSIHFMHARIQEMYIGKLQSGGYKMTNAGISKANSDLLSLLNSWTKTPFTILDGDPEFAPTVTTPTIADLSPSQKAQGLLPDIEFTGRLQSGFILLEVRGSVTV